MSITPSEIREIDLRRAWLRGYRRRDVDELLEEIADSFEEVMRERAHLSDRVEELEADAAKHRELETLLHSTLVSAERAAREMKEQARRESDLIVQEAHAESRRVTRASAAEKHRLEEDMTKIRAQLRAAFEMLGEWPESAVDDERGSSLSDCAGVDRRGLGQRHSQGRRLTDLAHGASRDCDPLRRAPGRGRRGGWGRAHPSGSLPTGA